MPPGRTSPARTARRLTSALALAGAAVLAGCSGAASTPSPDTRTAGAPTVAAPSASATATATASAAPTTPRMATPATPRVATPTPARPSSSRPTGPPEATDVATGLDTPWGLVALQDGSTLVSERDTGRILRVRDGDSTELTRLDDVRPGGEGGLLGLAITPDQKRVLAYLTAAEDNRIVAMSWDGSELGKPSVLLDGIPKGRRHNGGRLVVGPDGYLYVGTGEIGQEELAQDKQSLAGKILRVTLAGEPAPGNPFDNEVHSYGHRNVQGLAFDDQGRLWASEFGNQTWDELNLVTRGSNYGWPDAEGSSKIDGVTNPKLVWRTEEASPSGLAYWQGELWMAALRGERLWEIPVDGTKVGEPKAHFNQKYGRLRSVTATSDGRSLLLTASNTDGRADPKDDDDRVMAVRR